MSRINGGVDDPLKPLHLPESKLKETTSALPVGAVLKTFLAVGLRFITLYAFARRPCSSTTFCCLIRFSWFPILVSNHQENIQGKLFSDKRSVVFDDTCILVQQKIRHAVTESSRLYEARMERKARNQYLNTEGRMWDHGLFCPVGWYFLTLWSQVMKCPP